MVDGLQRRAARKPVPRRPVIRPVPVDDSGFTVEPDGEGGFVVSGARPERWVGQTNFDNDEAVGYLADRLARLGVEDELLRLGAQSGCAVTIGEMTFDWEPQTPAGSTVTMTGRGTDARLERRRPRRRRRAQGRPAPAPRDDRPAARQRVMTSAALGESDPHRAQSSSSRSAPPR